MTAIPLTEEASLESLVARVVDDFLERQKRGEQPDPAEYVARHPHAASVLREVLAALHVVGLSSCAALAAAGNVAEAEGPVAGTLGDFRILRELGRGGMGVVYEAEQISLGRRVTLKILPFAAALDSRQLQRFKQEAQAAGQLHHTNIVQVHAVGCERGVHYYAMQYIDGQTVAAIIRELQRNVQGPSTKQPFAEDDAQTKLRHSTLGIFSSLELGHSSFFRMVANWGIQAALALEHAHEKGVIHRDIKPANLLVDGKGNLWITDFGLARCRDNAGLTMTGDVVGTLRYMSPEQALAKHGLIDHRTDIYSLGVTLYELLTLQPAFNGGDREELLRQIALEEPRSPRQLNKAIPAELEIIVGKAMEKRPNDRYASAQELAKDLEHFLDNKPIRARPARWWERIWKWARRRPALTAVYGLVLLALALGGLGGGAAWLWHRAEAAHQEAAEARDQAQTALQQEQQARVGETEARRHLAVVSYLHKVQLAHHAWTGGDLLRAKLLLERCPEELRKWEWYHVHRRCHSELLTLQGHTGTVASVVYSPDGLRLLSSAEDHTVRAWDSTTGREILTIREEEGATISFSSECNQYACCMPVKNPNDGHSVGSELKVVEVTTGRVRFTVKALGSRFESATFSPDGKRLAARSNVLDIQTGRSVRGEVKLWDLTTSKDILTLLPHIQGIGGHAFSPDGKRLATWSGDKAVKVWNLAAGQEVFTLKGQGPAAFSPDGRRLATISGDGTVRLWNLLTGQEAFTLKGHTAGISNMAFSLDGKRLAGWGPQDKAVKVWDLASGQVVLKGHTERVACVVFSPDGRRLESTPEG